MIGTDRSYEHRGYATRRNHLMPVEAPCNRRSRVEVALTLLLVVMIATFVFGKALA